MRKRIGIYGVSEESLRLARLLSDSADVSVARFFASDRQHALDQADRLGTDFVRHLEPLLTDDLDTFADEGLHAVVDAGSLPSFVERVGIDRAAGLQVVTPLTARLLWGYGEAPRDRKAELLQALHEVVESVELTIDSDELFGRMLEIAVGVTGAEGGSLMLLDAARGELRIRVAQGVEPELWGKIRVKLGEGISGHVAASAEPLSIRGKADRRAYKIVRERLDVESALCVPLVNDGRVLGVLNVHHSTRPDAFGDDDLAFMEQLARLDSQIIVRAQEHEALRSQAARYDAVREVHALLAGPATLPDRLTALCRFVARQVDHGVASVYLHDPDETDATLRLAATSLEGGGFGGEYRLRIGEGVDGGAAKARRPSFLRGDGGRLSYAALPLIAGERLLGVLSIQGGPEAPRGRAAEEALLEITAAAAEGVAQANREALLETRTRRVNAINETGIRMLSATELTEVAQLATSSVAMILEADHVVLRLHDEQTGRYTIRSYFGAADGPTQEKLFRLDKTVCIGAIRQRQARLVRVVADAPDLAPLAEGVRSLMTSPIKRRGRVVGTLSLYDKVAIDRFFPGRFNEDDLQIFGRFVSYAERAVDNAYTHSQTRQHRNFDDETGLPNAAYLATRLREELARAGARDGALAVSVCTLENLDEIREQAGPAHAHRVVQKCSEALRAHLRDFDVLARSDDSRFTTLLPEPGTNPGERVFELARAVADAIAKDEALNAPVRVGLSFGYAVHPEDGADREGLLAAAREPRIRMV